MQVDVGVRTFWFCLINTRLFTQRKIFGRQYWLSKTNRNLGKTMKIQQNLRIIRIQRIFEGKIIRFKRLISLNSYRDMPFWSIYNTYLTKSSATRTIMFGLAKTVKQNVPNKNRFNKNLNGKVKHMTTKLLKWKKYWFCLSNKQIELTQAY